MVTPELSIVFPAYNEANRLPRTLEQVFDWSSRSGRSVEILVVDDGSTDAMLSALEPFSSAHDNLRIVSYSPNRGKGFALRTGIREARGTFVLMSDADLSTPIEDVESLFARMLEDDLDICIGSRALPDSEVVVPQAKLRQLSGKMYNRLLRAFLLDGFQDTQCGFKLFRRASILPMLDVLRIDRFGFDVEILFVARLWGLSIAEVPVRWYNSADSRVSFTRDATRMFFEIFQIRLNHRRGLYKKPPGLDSIIHSASA